MLRPFRFGQEQASLRVCLGLGRLIQIEQKLRHNIQIEHNHMPILQPLEHLQRLLE
ncbi:hypothetical protein D3C81_345170 [compost metagenome]